MLFYMTIQITQISEAGERYLLDDKNIGIQYNALGTHYFIFIDSIEKNRNPTKRCKGAVHKNRQTWSFDYFDKMTKKKHYVPKTVNNCLIYMSMHIEDYVINFCMTFYDQQYKPENPKYITNRHFLNN